MAGDDDTADLKIMPTEELRELLHVDDEPVGSTDDDETADWEITGTFRALLDTEDRSGETIVLDELDLMATTEFQAFAKPGSEDTDPND